MKKLLTLTLSAGLFLGLAHTAQAETDIQRITTPSGAHAWLVNAPQPRIVDVEMAFSCGSVFDPVGKEGLANLTSTLYNESIGDYSTIELAQELKRVGATLHGDAGGYTLNVNLRVLSRNADEGFRLLGTSILNPAFSEEDVARMRQQILSGLAQDANDPSHVAGRRFSEAVYGNHPLGRPHKGTPETVASLTAEDVRAFHESCTTRANATISVVGDISAERLNTLLETYLGDMTPGDARNTPPSLNGIDRNPALIRVDMSVPQSTLTMGHLIDLPREHEDFWPLHVANSIFGSMGMSHRLFTEVRAKRGLAYGVGSGVVPLKGRAMFRMNTATRNAAVEEAMTVMRTEMAEWVENGVTEQELADAKAYLSGEYPIRLGTNTTILTYLTLIQQEDLPFDYMDTRVDKILAVTQEDIQRALTRHLNPSDLTVVIVGGSQ